MKPRDVVLSIIGEVTGHDEFGRTSLQKVSYLTSLLIGMDLGHSAYYYGPYSPAVEANAEALAIGGLIKENSETIGINARGFPLLKYTYTITEQGEERLQRVRDAHPDQSQSIKDIVAKIEATAGSFDQNTLSAVSKTFYIAKEQSRPISPGEVQEFAKELGWTLRTRKIEEVIQMLSELGLVEVGP
jgi:uncharacterized protein YwgA